MGVFKEYLLISFLVGIDWRGVQGGPQSRDVSVHGIVPGADSHRGGQH